MDPSRVAIAKLDDFRIYVVKLIANSVQMVFLVTRPVKAVVTNVI